LKVEFTISGECESKERPRFNKRRGTVRTADKTRHFEEYIKWVYGKKHSILLACNSHMYLSSLNALPFNPSNTALTMLSISFFVGLK
jgi:hypothetical protein